MKGLNLLPEELRGQEEKILSKRGTRKANGKTPKMRELPKDNKGKKKQIESPLMPKKSFRSRFSDLKLRRKEEKPKKEEIIKKPHKEKLIVSEETKPEIIKPEEIKPKVVKNNQKAKLELIKEKEVKEKPTAELTSTFDVNLMPEELTGVPREEVRSKIWALVIFVFIFVFLVTLAYIGSTWYQLTIDNQIRNLNLEISKVNKEIAVSEQGKGEILVLQKKLKSINDLLENHIFWTELFTLLEKYTVPEVYFTNFSADFEGNLILSANTSSYKNVARQLVAFQGADDLVKNVSITSASAQLVAITEEGVEKSVSFDVKIDLAPELFFKLK